jgi:hypothetical protein
MSNAKLATQVAENKNYTYDLLDDDRYLLAQVDGQKVLLDTGCPWTLKMPGGPEVLNLLGQPFRLRHSSLSRSFAEEGFDMLNVDFTAMVGMDVLGKIAWTFDKTAHTAVATIDIPAEDGVSWVPLDSLNGPPICKLDGGSDAIVDTGAHYSYCIGSVPRTAKVVGEFVDWSILWGAVHSHLWEDTLCIGGQRFLVRFGKLPSKAESTLAWMGTGWIIGADLLRQFRVTMDFPRGRMGLQALASSQTPHVKGGPSRG